MCFLVSVCAAANAVVSASPRRRPPEPPRRQPRDGLRRPRTLQRRSRLVAGRLEPRPRRMVPSKAAGDSVMILHVRQVQVRSGSAPGAPVTDLSPQPDGPIWHTLGVDEVLAAEDVDPRRASTQPRSPRGLSASVRTDSRRARRSPGCMRSSVSSPTPADRPAGGRNWEPLSAEGVGDSHQVGHVRRPRAVQPEAVPAGDRDRVPGAPAAPQSGRQLRPGRVVRAHEHHPRCPEPTVRHQPIQRRRRQPHVRPPPIRLRPAPRDQPGLSSTRRWCASRFDGRPTDSPSSLGEAPTRLPSPAAPAPPAPRRHLPPPERFIRLSMH